MTITNEMVKRAAEIERRAQKQSATLMTKYTPEQRREWGLKGAAAAKAAMARRAALEAADEVIKRDSGKDQ